jgi:ABC-type sugar transport system substrate-binding protein
MLRKTAVGCAVAVAVTAVAAAPATSQRGAARKTVTVAFATDATSSPRVKAIAGGGRSAAKRLGVRFILAGPAYGGPPGEVVSTFQSLIARHVDAIATEGYIPELKPILAKVRRAGITLIASGDDIAARRALWIGQSAPLAYAEALADALASQIKGTGEYAIVRQPGQFPIADEWQHLVAAYVAKAYPKMHLDGVVEGSDPTGTPEPEKVEGFMASHPKLVGFVAVVPRGAYAVAEAIEKTGKVGKVFSAANGGGSFSSPLPSFVRSGVAELVYGADPAKLGYLTVWAADYLLTGHRFKPGAYQVGGPIGLVRYYARRQELRLGQPLTIDRTNADRYANRF